MSRQRLWCAALLLISLRSGCPLSSVLQQQPALAGDWAGAKAALRSPKCCVVSVSGLEPHLRALQAQWVADPGDVDLRQRVRVSSARDDCLRVLRAASPSLGDDESRESDPVLTALEELARGVASLADGPLEGVCEGVFVRVVCASDYRAREPMFHTDKCPLRAYVTLRGPGTEFMARPSTPIEYVTLRTGAGEPTGSVRAAEELEFIVMKGDYYQSPEAAPWLSSLWQRASSCVHRSPPAETAGGGRRVILSLDLAAGEDDREWHEADKRKSWRSGMNQKKGILFS